MKVMVLQQQYSKLEYIDIAILVALHWNMVFIRALKGNMKVWNVFL